MLLHFPVLLTSLGLGVLLSFFLRPLLFHFPDPWMRAFARTLSHSCSRAHSPSRSRARLFLHARVGVLVAWSHSGAHVPFPPLVFVARLPPLLVWMLAFGGGLGSLSLWGVGCCTWSFCVGLCRAYGLGGPECFMCPLQFSLVWQVIDRGSVAAERS